MEVRFDLIEKIAKSNKSQIVKMLRHESSDSEVTKSIVNILYNLDEGVISIPYRVQQYLEQNDTIVKKLLKKSNMSTFTKQKLLIANPMFAFNIAAACPPTVGLW